MRISLRRSAAAVATAVILLAGAPAAYADVSRSSIAAADTCNVQVSANQYKPAFKSGTVLKRDCYQNDVNYVVAATKAIQVSYNRCYAIPRGWTQLVDDGVYGSRTVTAIANVQGVHGLSADGLYGPVTAQSMNFYNSGTGRCASWGNT